MSVPQVLSSSYQPISRCIQKDDLQKMILSVTAAAAIVFVAVNFAIVGTVSFVAKFVAVAGGGIAAGIFYMVSAVLAELICRIWAKFISKESSSTLGQTAQNLAPQASQTAVVSLPPPRPVASVPPPPPRSAVSVSSTLNSLISATSSTSAASPIPDAPAAPAAPAIPEAPVAPEIPVAPPIPDAPQRQTASSTPPLRVLSGSGRSTQQKNPPIQSVGFNFNNNPQFKVQQLRNELENAKQCLEELTSKDTAQHLIEAANNAVKIAEEKLNACVQEQEAEKKAKEAAKQAKQAENVPQLGERSSAASRSRSIIRGNPKNIEVDPVQAEKDDRTNAIKERNSAMQKLRAEVNSIKNEIVKLQESYDFTKQQTIVVGKLKDCMERVKAAEEEAIKTAEEAEEAAVAVVNKTSEVEGEKELSVGALTKAKKAREEILNYINNRKDIPDFIKEKLKEKNNTK